MFHDRSGAYRTVVKRSFWLAALALAGCSGDTNPVRDALTSVGVAPQVKPAPDFVAQSRPAQVDYQPVGSAAPARATPAWKPDQVKAVEQELEAARTRNEAQGAAVRRAGATPAPAPAQPQ